MQVNKYVHPCETIPTILKPSDIKKLSIDYNNPQNERIKDHLEKFDEIILTLMVGGKDGTQSRIRRFKNDYLVDDEGYNSEEEANLAYQMFYDDVQKLRVFFQNSLHDCLSTQIGVEKLFAKEREFFMKENQKAKNFRK